MLCCFFSNIRDTQTWAGGGGRYFPPEVQLLYIPVLLEDFKCGQLLLGVMESSIFSYLARQVYDVDHVF